jgi:hypothetical protein
MHHYAPGKILGFIDNLEGGCSAIVLCCEYVHKRSGVFSTYWKLEFLDKANKRPYIQLIDTESIVRHCLMIPENDENCGFHEIWDKERWAEEFCEFDYNVF